MADPARPARSGNPYRQAPAAAILLRDYKFLPPPPFSLSLLTSSLSLFFFFFFTRRRCGCIAFKMGEVWVGGARWLKKGARVCARARAPGEDRKGTERTRVQLTLDRGICLFSPRIVIDWAVVMLEKPCHKLKCDLETAEACGGKRCSPTRSNT